MFLTCSHQDSANLLATAFSGIQYNAPRQPLDGVGGSARETWLRGFLVVSDVHFIYAGNRREPVLLAEKPLHGLAEKLKADLRGALTASGVFV